MESSIRLLQIIRIAMVLSIVLYVFVGETLARQQNLRMQPNSALYLALTLVAITIVGIIVAVRRRIVFATESVLSATPQDIPAQARWRTGYILTYALCESIALFGLVLRVTGFPLSQVAAFYIVGFALMLFFAPRRPSST